MTITLHRYIVKDLLKTFLLATVGLTVVLSLGSILQPAQEYGVSPAQALLLIVYFIPVILTFVMPISALFAAALTYGRFASDNELDACRASGVSTLNLMLSALMLAVLVSVANLLLNFYVVPHFISKTEQNIKANVRNIVFRSIEKQGYYDFSDSSRGSNTYILADKVDLNEDVLLGVNILQTKGGKAKSLTSVSQADVDFESTDSYNYISAVAQDVYQADASGVIYSQKLPIKGKFAPLLLDNIRFKKLSDLKAIKNDVLLFNPVDDYANSVLVRLRSEMLAEAISRRSEDSSSRYYQLNSDQKIVMLSASESEVGSSDNVISLTDVSLYEYSMDNPDELLNKWVSSSGTLDINDQWGQGSWTLVLDNAVWTDKNGVTGLPISYSVRGIYTPQDISNDLDGYKLEVIQNVTPITESEKLQRLKAEFDDLLAETSAAMAVEMNSRMVLGLGCILLVLCGAALGVLFKGGHALTSFGISVVPAGILIVFIMMGRNLTKNIVRNQGGTGELGILLMWAGLLVLLVLLLYIYKKLLKT
ncbi:MAG: LptF/LptG family permease [Sedimentisphaeraceae bacterium JB056]